MNKTPIYSKELEKLLDDIIEEANTKNIALPSELVELIYYLRLHRPAPLPLHDKDQLRASNMLYSRYPTNTNPVKPAKELPAINPRTIQRIRKFAYQVAVRHRAYRLTKLLYKLTKHLSPCTDPKKLAPYIAYQLPLPPEHQTRIMLTMLATAYKNMTRSLRAMVYAAKKYIDKHVKDKKLRIQAKKRLEELSMLSKPSLANPPDTEPVIITDPREYFTIIQDRFF